MTSVRRKSLTLLALLDLLPPGVRRSQGSVTLDGEDLTALGRDLDRRVLARAVRWHCEERVLVHGNKTVVFA